MPFPKPALPCQMQLSVNRFYHLCCIIATSVFLGACSTLPENTDQEQSLVFSDTANTTFGRYFKRESDKHSGESGVYLLSSGKDALAARLGAILDHAIAEVKQTGAGTTVVVEDKGRAVMPTVVKAVYEDESTERKTIDEATWWSGTTAEVRFRGKPVEVVLDPDIVTLDAVRDNNRWRASRK